MLTCWIQMPGHPQVPVKHLAIVKISTLQLTELYSSTWGKYQFPSWYAFTQAVQEKFKDPAIEDKQKALMNSRSLPRKRDFELTPKIAAIWSRHYDKESPPPTPP
ncbi:uncharacterized protein ARMOST_07538 [Armillaria ostoyae]|uniref:Uncharacterized protein n=1 Tax=Armillaria ostoyae TaxID=47428 RepID=A0A284R632_ARMOS|nr:uncharacterized protein ARMOST_07538 [Armillaria ostoyae]